MSNSTDKFCSVSHTSSVSYSTQELAVTTRAEAPERSKRKRAENTCPKARRWKTR